MVFITLESMHIHIHEQDAARPTWGPSHATSTGQTRGTDVYTVSELYSCDVTVNDIGVMES